MAAATFNGTDLEVLLAAPVAGKTLVDLLDDIYSEWKEFMLADPQNQGFPPLFLSGTGILGGQNATPTQVITASAFINNTAGWRIVATDADQDVEVTGNLYVTDTTLPIFKTIPGRTVSYFIDRSVNARDLSDANNVIMRKLMTNRIHTDPVTGIMTVWDDNDIDVFLMANLWKNTAGTIAYDGIVGGAERKDKMA